jgi:hypothetical protein
LQLKVLVFKIKNAYTNIKKAWVVIMFINLIKLSPLFNSILVTALFLILGEIVSFFNLPTPIYEFILLVVYLSFAYFFTKKMRFLRQLSIPHFSVILKAFFGDKA